MKRQRIIGTSEKSIQLEEKLLNRELPKSFKLWLIENNGLGIEDVNIFPVKDSRDIRKTWESLSYVLNHSWSEWIGIFEEEGREYNHLLPFADFGTGDYYCFDYNNITDSECMVVIWSHETGETEFRAINFMEFMKKTHDGEFKFD